ncbi:hypothetical protein RFI_09350, partial [Reticulomyxa filosa]
KKKKKKKKKKNNNNKWFTPDVWDAIFLGKDIPKDCKVPTDLITTMRKEFEYWYPLDLRVSGKDLIPNHLTMCLYNHAAIWKDDPRKWPLSFFANGHILIDKEKMSKQTGNFLTLNDTIKLYGADATRLALADAGDTLEDANFSKDVANSAVLKLTKLQTWIENTIESVSSLRDGPYSNLDKMFDNAINAAIIDTDVAYANMQFRQALGCGYYNLENAKNYYVTHVHGGPHNPVVTAITHLHSFLRIYVEQNRQGMTNILKEKKSFLFFFFFWSKENCVKSRHKKKKKKKNGIAWIYHQRNQKFELLQGIFIIVCLFFSPSSVAIGTYVHVLFFLYVIKKTRLETSHRFRQEYSKYESDRQRKKKKAKKLTPELENPANAAIVCVADSYKLFQEQTILALQELYDEKSNELTTQDWRAYLLKQKFLEESKDENLKPTVLRFANYLLAEILPQRKERTFDLKLPFNEYEFAASNVQFLMHGLDIQLSKVYVQKVIFICARCSTVFKTNKNNLSFIKH